jgi:hypothetical protein
VGSTGAMELAGPSTGLRRSLRSKCSTSAYTPPPTKSPGRATSIDSELKGKSRIDDVVAVAVLFVHIKRLGAALVHSARVNEVKVTLDGDFSEN